MAKSGIVCWSPLSRFPHKLAKATFTATSPIAYDSYISILSTPAYPVGRRKYLHEVRFVGGKAQKCFRSARVGRFQGMRTTPRVIHSIYKRGRSRDDGQGPVLPTQTIREMWRVRLYSISCIRSKELFHFCSCSENEYQYGSTL